MENLGYWSKLEPGRQFREVDIEAPEQKRLAGKLLVLGGCSSAFFAEASTAQIATRMGAGEVRVLLPDSLRGKAPAAPEVYFARTGAAGAFVRESMADVLTQVSWADALLLPGDLGKNAETSMMLVEAMEHCAGKPVVITRDAVGTLTGADAENWLEHDGGVFVFATMPQLQKLFRAIYYPKMITLSMPVNQLVETLHKFTLSYGATIGTFCDGQIVLAEAGKVISVGLEKTEYNAISLWSGELAARTAVLKMWNPSQSPFGCACRAVM